MKAEKNYEQSIPKEAEKEGKKHVENAEHEVERTEGKRQDQESPIPNANQHRSKGITSKPEHEDHDTM